MGKTKLGILGQIRGKVGPVVGAIWRGVNVLKGMPNKSNKPPTEEQLDQQARFGLVTSFVGNAKSLINIGYYGSGEVETPTNKATSLILQTAVVGTYPNYTINYPKVELSQGDLDGLGRPIMTIVPATQSITLAWDVLDSVTNANALAERNTDQLMIYIYSPSLDKYYTREGLYTRGELTKTFYVPSLLSETPIHVWVFLKTAKGRRVSESQYLGMVTFPES